jgi:hypothetical protein
MPVPEWHVCEARASVIWRTTSFWRTLGWVGAGAPTPKAAWGIKPPSTIFIFCYTREGGLMSTLLVVPWLVILILSPKIRIRP